MGILTIMSVVVLLLFFTSFIMRGFFDSQWREDKQETIDCIKRERIFWNLMNGNYNFDFDLSVRGVFRFYIKSLTGELIRGEDVLSARDFMQQGFRPDDLDKKIIKKNNGWLKNIEILNSIKEGKEKSIEIFFNSTALTITKADIEKILEDFNYYFYDQKLKDYIFHFIKSENTGLHFWEVMKILKDQASRSEFGPTGNHRVDPYIWRGVKETEATLNNFIISLISEKIEDKKKARTIEKLLNEWVQLNMLLWCIVTSHPFGKTSIGRGLWRIVEKVFL